MTIDITQEQRAISDEAARFLQERSSSERVRRTIESGAGTDMALWRAISGELGWCAMAIPEEHGGLGLGMTEMALLQEQCGMRLACTPLWATICLAAPLVQELGREDVRANLLAAIAAGELALTVAFSDPSRFGRDDAITVSARRTADGFMLDGIAPQVVDLAVADRIIVPARIDGGETGLFLLGKGAGVSVSDLRTLDTTRPMARLALDGVTVGDEARIDDGVDPERLAKALAFASLALAAEQVGAARGVMDLTLAYISERVQFGRTIASFQAIKHRCARLEIHLAEARALIFGAAANFGTMPATEREMEVAGARLLATALLHRASVEAIQMHGGVGFTWEYDPHFYLKRAQAGACWFGGPDAQVALVAGQLFGEGNRHA